MKDDEEHREISDIYCQTCGADFNDFSRFPKIEGSIKEGMPSWTRDKKDILRFVDPDGIKLNTGRELSDGSCFCI